jgi:hypothetical protein
MKEPLKHLMQELGNAINDSLSESDRIAEAIGQIKSAGYDVFLVLEATIGFNKRDSEDDAEAGDAEANAEADAEAGMEIETEAAEAPRSRPENKRHRGSTGRVKFTTQDQRFLRALKISVEEEPER